MDAAGPAYDGSAQDSLRKLILKNPGIS